MHERSTSQKSLVVIVLILISVFVLGVCLLGILRRQNSDKFKISNCQIISTGQDITVQLDTDQNSIRPNSITYKITNNSQFTISYGEQFRLYGLDHEGNLSELTMLDGYAWQDILYYVEPGSSRINTDFLSGFKLSKNGTYRLQHDFEINGQKSLIEISFVVR